MSFLSAFTKQSENFMNELHELYPKDKDIALAKNSIYLLKKTNPKKIFTIFKENIYPYKEQIFNKNENFFLDYNYTSDYGVSNSFNTIMNLKKYWKLMSNTTKNSIWLYLQVLLKLSDKIN